MKVLVGMHTNIGSSASRLLIREGYVFGFCGTKWHHEAYHWQEVNRGVKNIGVYSIRSVLKNFT